MERILIGLILVSVTVLNGCASNEQTFNNYRYYRPKHKAWATSSHGPYGYAWSAVTVRVAMKEALNFCRKHGGRDCKITNVDGLDFAEYEEVIEQERQSALEREQAEFERQVEREREYLEREGLVTPLSPTPETKETIEPKPTTEPTSSEVGRPKRRSTSDTRVREAQKRLNSLGYNPGPADGVMGPKTRAAIQAFQRVRGLNDDGKLDDRLLSLLRADTPRATATSTSTDERVIDKMTTYAVMLGRAIGCGLDMSGPSRRVGRWMDRHFPPGSSSQRTYLLIFVEGMKHHAQQQASGNSPDSCATVQRVIDTTPWP